MKKINLIIFFSFLSYFSYSQCTNGIENTSVAVLNDGNVQELSGTVETNEYVTVTNIIPGDQYVFTNTHNENGTKVHEYITIRNSSNVIIVSGMSPLTTSAISVSTIRIHISVDAVCNVDTYFHSVTNVNLSKVTCNKPESPGINYKSNSRIDFYWSPPVYSTPVDYEWEIVPFGNAQGIGVIASGLTGGATNASSGDVLSSNTSYSIFVRSNCDTNGNSAYLGPLNFTTNMNPPPANDFCSGAITIIEQTGVIDAASATPTSGTLLGGAGTDVNAESCGGGIGNARDDVWYKFVAKTSNVHITVEPNPSFDVVVTLYSGDCNTLTYLDCSDVNISSPSTEEINFSGLTIGQTYYTRTYSYGSTTPGTPTFNIKIWSTTSATDADNDGYVDSVDCNDNDPMINPETIWYLDADGDNYAVSTLTQCTSPGVGYTTTVLPFTDCNDSDSSINPDTVWYLDSDSDNYAVSTLTQCTSPGVGYTTTVLPFTDCNDSDSSINPDTVWYLDADSDNYAVSTMTQCTNPGAGYTTTVLPLTDCDDGDSSIKPGATEIWYDGIDQNCDGQSDYDQDGDGYDSESFGGNDCDDTNFDVNPGKTEIEGNGLDDDCNPSTSDNPLGLEEFDLNKVKISPNPFNQSVTIHLPLGYNNDIFSIGLYDLNGRLIFQKNIIAINNSITIDHLSVLQQGMYFIKITNKEGNKNVVRELIKY